MRRPQKLPAMMRGEIRVGDLGPNRGSVAENIRAIVVVQADLLADEGEPTVIVPPLATRARPA